MPQLSTTRDHYSLFLAMFSPLHSVINKEHYEKDLCNQLRKALVGKPSHSTSYHILTPCTVSKDKRDTGKATGVHETCIVYTAALYVLQHCMYYIDVLQHCIYCSIVCTAALYVLQHCMYCSIVCTAALYVLQHCMYCSIVCTAALYVLQHCMYCSIVCTAALYILQHCMY